MSAVSGGSTTDTLTDPCGSRACAATEPETAALTIEATCWSVSPEETSCGVGTRLICGWSAARLEVTWERPWMDWNACTTWLVAVCSF